MPLDNFDIDKSNERKAQVPDTGALAQFGESLAYEAQREWAAIGQLVGADVQLPDAPHVAETALGIGSSFKFGLRSWCAGNTFKDWSEHDASGQRRVHNGVSSAAF